jgi:hypothetical protein
MDERMLPVVTLSPVSFALQREALEKLSGLFESWEKSDVSREEKENK